MKNSAVVKIKKFIKNEAGIFLVGNQFVGKKDLFRSPMESSRLEIFSVERLSPLRCWPLSSIAYKSLLIPTKIERDQEFAVFPLKMSLHTE